MLTPLEDGWQYPVLQHYRNPAIVLSTKIPAFPAMPQRDVFAENRFFPYRVEFSARR
jgi:hypothetical protein